MSRFHTLRIADLKRETEDAVSIAFEVERRLQRAFKFKHGQFLTLRAIVDGREVRRCYSICSGADEGELRIAVKRVEGGIFSTYAVSRLQVGQRIDVMEPQGSFYLPIEPQGGRRYLLCATGSGITPLLSIAKTVLAGEPLSSIVLAYGNRTKSEALFLADLAALQARYGRRLDVRYFYSRDVPSAGELQGRLDGRVLSICEEIFGSVANLDACFLCGTPGMITDLSVALRAAGVDDDRIHAELFDAPPSDGTVPPGVCKNAIATLLIDGVESTVDLGSLTVLDAALRDGIELPFSCRTGSCSSCVARVVEGEAHMWANNALEKWAVEQGFVLSCQTRSLTPRLKLQFGVELTAP